MCPLAPVGLSLNVNQFPWSTMPGVLANAGVRIVNYPVGVIFPGHEKEKQRGITAASAVHIDSILEHLSPSAAQQIRFELIPDAVVKRYADKRGKLPVIINAAPQPQSKFVRGSRLLADSSVDDQGPWRLKPGDQEDSPDFVESVDEDGPSKARTRIRKRKERAPPSESDAPEPSEAERRVLRSERKGKGKARATGTESALSISDEDSRGVQHKRLRRQEASPDTAIEVKTPQGILKKQPAGRHDALPPLKKVRSVVEGKV